VATRSELFALLAVENPLDELIKTQVVQDTLRIAEPLPVDRAALLANMRRRTENKEKPWQASGASTTALMDQDLHQILCGSVPRAYGEMPAQIGNYERIAPSPLYDQIVKHRRAPRGAKAKC